MSYNHHHCHHTGAKWRIYLGSSLNRWCIVVYEAQSLHSTNYQVSKNTINIRLSFTGLEINWVILSRSCHTKKQYIGRHTDDTMPVYPLWYTTVTFINPVSVVLSVFGDHFEYNKFGGDYIWMMPSDNSFHRAALQLELQRKYERNFEDCSMRRKSLQIELAKMNYINRSFLPSPNGSSADLWVIIGGCNRAMRKL